MDYSKLSDIELLQEMLSITVEYQKRNAKESKATKSLGDYLKL